MITFKAGDIFKQPVDALVNPVNCVGVMGKGLALEFKKRFPSMFKAYSDLCRYGDMRLGKVKIIESGAEAPSKIILLPTKGHWRENSRYEMVRLALIDMNQQCEEAGIRSVALPAVGCGEGGLDWRVVRSIMEKILGRSEVHYIAVNPLPSIEIH